MISHWLITEQRFVLDNIVRVEELGTDGDLIDSVLTEALKFADAEWAPLARLGDVEGAVWTDDGVRMPAGFADAYRTYVEAGWAAVGAPQEVGGQGLPFAIQAAVLETLGIANLAFALCPMLTHAAVDALHRHGSDSQKARYVPKLATGEWTGTMNLTEPQAGSDVGALRTRAEPREDGLWAISGTKIFISFGDHDMADNIVHLVLARTPGAPEGTRGISLFLVPKYRLRDDGTPGAFNDVRAVSIEHKMGLHASPTCTLSFGDNGDCLGELIGPENAGMRAMFTMMNNARLNVGLQGVQVAEAATQRAAQFAMDRVQSARAGAATRVPVKIIEHPDVRRMLLRMKAQTQAARALVYYAAGQVDRAEAGDAAAKNRLELLTPLAKAHATDVGNEVASLGIQIHGGMGFIEETGAAQHFRDARITPIYEGTNGIQAADLVGRKLTLANGAAFASLIFDMRAEAQDSGLTALIDACEAIGRRLAEAKIEDRLAASYPFLTMLSVAVCGWLMERQLRSASNDSFGEAKRAIAAFYIGQVLPEALGLGPAAQAKAEMLYAISGDALVA
jgi:alkylation response protein AidB-like acyl-CoA dehydrogenase